jgi:Pyruvate/2-oxoacid:ferredoxin oxidoreductase gamma subunit
VSLSANSTVAGEAGQGVQSVGYILAKAFARGGHHVFTDQDYESRIRETHNFFRIRVSDSEVAAILEDADILLALNRESVELHHSEPVPREEQPAYEERLPALRKGLLVRRKFDPTQAEELLAEFL